METFEPGRGIRLALVALASVVLLALALTACAPAPPVPAPVVVAPMPAAYTCSQLARAADEFDALPAGSMIGQMMDDYRVERRALKALRQLPEQRCP